MHDRRRYSVLTAGVIVLLMGLFPPWQEFTAHRQVYMERPAGRAFVFSAPRPQQLASIEIDRTRLFLGWGLVAVALGLWLNFGPAQQSSLPEMPKRDAPNRLPEPSPGLPRDHRDSELRVVEGVLLSDGPAVSKPAEEPLVLCRSCGQKLRLPRPKVDVVRCPKCRSSFHV